jgi:long-chain acyl-CoA synthetase
VLNGYLTPSMTLKRSKVLADFAGEVEKLYVDTRPAS